MAVIRNLVVKIAADISSLSKGLQSAQKSIQKVSASLTKAGTKLTATVTAPLVGLAAKAVSVSQQFEQSMANAGSVAGATGEDFEKMTAIAREMGSKTVFSASQAADALYYMASAGYKVDQMADSIEATLNLAAATQTDLADATSIVISTLNMYGMEASSAERVTNVFAAAIGNSMATMGKLSESMSYVGPVANSLGYSIEETVGALSVLYNAGYEGSQAGTVLRQALVNLMNPTSSAIGVFEELGISLDEINPSTHSFAEIIARLGDAGMDTAQAMKVFGARGGPGMLALLSAGSDAVVEMTESITGTNKATEMASIQLDTLQGQYKILKSELEEIAIAFGDILIPIIRQFITKYISPLTARLMGLNSGQKKQIVLIAAIAAAIGPLLLVLGKVVGSVGTILKVGGLLFSKVGLIIAGVAAVIAILIYLWNTNEDFRNAVKKIWEKIKSIIVGALNVIKSWWQQNGATIKEQVISALNTILEAVGRVIGAIVSIIQELWPYIEGIFSDLLNGAKTAFTNMWRIISKVLGAIKSWWNENGEAIKDAVISVLKKILTTVRNVFNKIQKISEKIWNAVFKVISDVLNMIGEIWRKDGKKIVAEVSRVFNSIWAIIESVLDVLLTAFSKFLEYLAPIWEKVKALIMTLWNTFVDLYQTLKPVIDLLGGIIATILSVVMGVIDGILSALGPFLEAVIEIITAIIEIIQVVCAILRGDWSEAWEHMKNVAGNIWEAIKHIFEGIWEFIKGFGEGFVQFWKNIGVDIVALFKGIIDSIANFFVNLWEGIKSVFTNIWNGVTGLFRSIGDFFKNLFSEAFNWGKNLINNIWEGIKSAWNWVVDGIKSIGQAIADFLGFGSPTKKGPCHTADEWIPNLMSMMEEGMYDDVPEIERASMEVASALNITGNVNRSMVGSGVSPYGDLLNGLLQGLTAVNQSVGAENSDIVLEIDGQRFARYIMPRLNKEYKRNGIVMKEV